MRNENLNAKKITQLSKAFLQLKTVEETRNFLRDLMTIQELKTVASRFEAANLLFTTEKSYRTIAKETSLSTTTITRVSDWLNRGTNGYITVLSRMFKKLDTANHQNENKNHRNMTKQEIAL